MVNNAVRSDAKLWYATIKLHHSLFYIYFP